MPPTSAMTATAAPTRTSVETGATILAKRPAPMASTTMALFSFSTS